MTGSDETPDERHEELADRILGLIARGVDPREALHSASIEPGMSVTDVMGTYAVIERRKRDDGLDPGRVRKTSQKGQSAGTQSPGETGKSIR